MIKRIFLYIILIISTVSNLYGETEAGIFNPRFRTLKTSLAGNFMFPAVMRLGSDDHIVIIFDEIGEDYSDLQYRLIHCNANWEPSRLVESEYLSGFNIGDVEDYAYSVNTYVHYVNYMITIPNERMAPLVSGNYILEVFPRENPEEILVRARFRVVEPLVKVSGRVSLRTDRGVNGEWQQPELILSTVGYPVSNPYQDLKVEIYQNNRDITSRIIKNPLRIDGSDIIYKHNPELLFPASNEYRRFESTSTLFPEMHVDSLAYMGSNYHVWLKVDKPRGDRNYEFDKTQHGRFLVKEYNATDSDIAADYITVHFLLDTGGPISEEIYVDGEMTYGRFTDKNRMKFNSSTGLYELELPVKQGAYNYQYVTFDREGVFRNTKNIEGNKYETENEYTVYLYHTPPGARYDRLVGTGVFTE